MQKVKLLFGAISIFILSACTKENTNEQNLLDTSTPVLHYEFANNLNDISGNGFTATSDTAIDFVPDRFSRINQAIRFNGPLHKSYFLMPPLGSKQVGNKFSISFWFTITSANSTNLFYKSDFAKGVESGVYILTSNGRLRVVLGDSINTREYNGNNLLNANTWKHFALTADSNNIKIYLDGVLYNNQMAVNNSGNFVSTAFKGNPNVAIGLLGGLQPYPLTDGKLDDFRVYRRAISATEVTALYNYQP